jgi:hypothetical protein
MIDFTSEDEDRAAIAVRAIFTQAGVSPTDAAREYSRQRAAGTEPMTGIALLWRDATLAAAAELQAALLDRFKATTSH